MSEREEVHFTSAGVRCAGWLYRPIGQGPAPVVVMAHGLGAVKAMRLDDFARRFRDAGYACLVFDYRHFGDSDGLPRQLLDIRRQVEDFSAAVAFARTLPGVDPERVVVWGTSFGGGHAIVTAAGDPRIAAAIAQCPFTDGLSSALAIHPVTSVKVMARAVRDVVAAARGKDPVLVATAGPRLSTALMTAPDAEPGYLALVDSGTPFRNEVAARVALRIMTHFPGRAAARVSCPILFDVCADDSVAPARATLRHARRAPRGEIAVYPVGHFDIYGGPAFERIIADQIAFLHRHVPPAAAGA